MPVIPQIWIIGKRTNICGSWRFTYPKPEVMSKKDIRDHTYLRYSDYSGCRSKNVDLVSYVHVSQNCLPQTWEASSSILEFLLGHLTRQLWPSRNVGGGISTIFEAYIIWLWVKSMVFWWSPEKPVFWGDHPHQTWHSNAFDRYWSIHITWLSSRPKCPQGSPFLRRSPCGACWQGGRGRGFIYLVLPLSYVY